MASLRRAFAIAQPIVIVIAFALIGVLLRSQWDALQAHPWHLRVSWLAASAALIAIGWLLEIRMWQRLLALVGAALEYRHAVLLWFTSAIVRYVPGNVWQPLSLTVGSRAYGVRPEATVASLSLFHVIHLLMVGPLVALYFAIYGRTSPLAYWFGSWSPWWSIPVLVPIVVLLGRPRWMLGAINRGLHAVGRDSLPLDMSAGRLAAVAGLSVGSWLGFAGGFAALAAAVVPDAGTALRDGLPHLLAAYPIAFAIGFLSMLTPGGLVVRDGVLFFLLAPVIGNENAIVVALAMRVWEIVLDAIAALIALAVRRRRA